MCSNYPSRTGELQFESGSVQRGRQAVVAAVAVSLLDPVRVAGARAGHAGVLRAAAV